MEIGASKGGTAISGKKTFAVLAIAVAVVAVLILMRLNTSTGGKPAIAARPVARLVQAVAEPVAETPSPAEAIESTEEESIAPPLPHAPVIKDTGEPDVKMGATGPPEVEAAIASARQALGWDKIKTLEVAGVMISDGKVVSKDRLILQAPELVSCTVEYDTGGGTRTLYHLTDGIVKEQGTIGPDGKRRPTSLEEFDGTNYGGVTLLGILKPGLYDSCETVKPDPTDPLFQNEDGTPISSAELLVLKSTRGAFSYEFYIDPETKRPVAGRSRAYDTVSDFRLIKYAEVSPGIFHPVEIELHTIGATQQVAGQVSTDVLLKWLAKPEDVKVNGAVDPADFHFSSSVP